MRFKANTVIYEDSKKVWRFNFVPWPCSRCRDTIWLEKTFRARTRWQSCMLDVGYAAHTCKVCMVKAKLEPRVGMTDNSTLNSRVWMVNFDTKENQDG